MCLRSRWQRGLLGALVWLPSMSGANRNTSVGRQVRAYAAVAREGPVAALMLARATTTVAFAAFVVLAGPKLVAAGGDLRTVGLFTLAGSVGGAVAQVAVGRLSDAVGRRGVLATAVMLGAGTAVAFGLADGVGLLLALSAVYFLAHWACQTMFLALCGDVARPGTMDHVVALQTCSYSWGVAVGAICAALTAETAPASAFVVGAGGLLLTLATLPWLRRRLPPDRATAPPSS